ncbi:MAG TPA: methyltransferase domain-containing protein [Anaerolineales bacterium]|nr:methyltransferase domain-containing protein [Anaerolineales bacterium]
MEESRKDHIIQTYRKRAANYDFTANLYYLFGYREWAYRRMAVKALMLQPGDTVLELACGTGINFPLFQRYIGSTGHIIGVDITDAMLEQAKKRVASQEWENVTLAQHDASTYKIPSNAKVVFSSYALSIFPDPKQVLTNIADSLAPGSRLTLIELQIPKFWPSWIASAAVALMKPFAVTDDWVARCPWETIRRTINEKFDNVEVTEHFFGLTYIISGEKSAS